MRAQKHIKPEIKTDTARQAALDCLRDVFNKKVILDVAFTQHGADLNPRDKAFAYTLTMGVIRFALGLDKQIAPMMQTPFPNNSDQQNILRMGLYQLFMMDGVKDHAAISATVDLTRANKLPHLSGVINGVLRNAQRNLKDQAILAEDCLPNWLRQKLSSDYGKESTHALASGMLSQACLDFRQRNGDAPQDATPLEGLTDGWRLPADTTATTLEGIQTGDVYIQDMAAQWPATLLLNNLKTDGVVLDMCAAPGGKTLQLLDGDKSVVAADRGFKRLRRLKENLSKTGKTAMLLAADGLKPSFADGSFAGILLDAPCSATGTTRRHPEVMHLRTTQDVIALQKLQQEMLTKSAALLKKGGVLVYAVCSLLHDEGEKQDLWALENLPLKPVALNNLPADIEPAKIASHCLRLTPTMGCDGFFIAIYSKS